MPRIRQDPALLTFCGTNYSLLEVYGTAGGGGRFLGTPQQAYQAGFG